MNELFLMLNLERPEAVQSTITVPFFIHPVNIRMFIQCNTVYKKPSQVTRVGFLYGLLSQNTLKKQKLSLTFNAMLPLVAYWLDDL